MPWKNHDTKTRSGRQSLSILEKHTLKKKIQLSVELGIWTEKFSVIFTQFVYMTRSSHSCSAFICFLSICCLHLGETSSLVQFL